MSQIEELIKSHSHWSAVEAISLKLRQQGYKVFLAGGCVRDALLGVNANDLDVATNATPAQIEKMFSKTIGVGRTFGVMRVVEQGVAIEVATFRTDGEYKDGRRPLAVKYATPEEDAQRRDFTVNALFYDLETRQVLDFVQGTVDLQKKTLRTVGSPDLRFKEDHLRLLRAARFVAQLGFTLNSETFQSIKDLCVLVIDVSGERIREEMEKLLKQEGAQSGLQVMVETGLMEQLFPFRAEDDSWVTSVPPQKLWHYFLYFLRNANSVDFKKATTLLKLSNRDFAALQLAWQILQRPQAFLELSPGKQLMKLSEEGFEYALQILVAEEHPEKEIFSAILLDWEAWGRALPKPWLTGDDVQGLRGRAIGQCLGLAFEMQLERKLNNRDQALQWVSDYKGESRGV